MEGSGEDDKDRRERIQSLVKKLKTRRTEALRFKGMKSTEGRRGNHSHYKLYLGWQHYDREKFRVVTIKKGGGTRMIHYKSDEPLSVDQILEEGKKRFFPEHESQYGPLEEMDISMANSAGQVITNFKDLEGNPCSFQNYLKEQGLYSSQCHLYVCTKKKNILKPQVFYLNGTPAPYIRIKYQKTVKSVYEDKDTTVSCSSTMSCKSITDTALDIEEFDPMDHGFSVKEFQIVESGAIFNTEQMKNETTNDNIICYGPEMICGMEEDCKTYLLLGAMPFIDNVQYVWDRNGVKIHNNKQFIKITEEGINLQFIY